MTHISLPQQDPPFRYRATVLRWIDGDTVDLDVDLGFRLRMTGRFRLIGINTPERGRPGYREATAFADGMAPAGTELVVQTYGEAGAFGRWLALLKLEDGRSVNEELLHAHLAVPYRDR